MFFASPLVYAGASSSDEFSETELEAGLVANAMYDLAKEDEEIGALAEEVNTASSSSSSGEGSDNDSASDGSAELDASIAVAQQQAQQQAPDGPQARGGKAGKGKKKKKGVRFELKKLFKMGKRQKAANSRRAVPSRAVPPRKKPIKTRRADTNVISLSLGSLADGVTLATGEAIRCSQCSAYFSAVSQVTPNDADADDEDDDLVGVWNCEFCGTGNEVELARPEIPTANSVDYVVSGMTVASDARESNVVFCVDTSGSMCVTTEVSGKVKLKGQDRRNKEFAELRSFGDGSNQFLRGQSRNTTYISRLQCMQAAVETQIETLAATEPAVRAGLVTFASDVKVVGDAAAAEHTIAGDHLDDYDHCLSAAAELPLGAPVVDSAPALRAKLDALSEEGQTALGPALVTAVGMAAQRPGSEVIVCTDGRANIGVGSISDAPTEAEEDETTAFYERVGLYAREAGVTVNVITIDGTDCSVENLGIVTDATSGTVDVVDPLELTSNFSSILAEPPVATAVEIVFLLHKGLRFREDDVAADSNILTRTIGNVKASSDVTFQYSVRRDFLDALTEDASVPFQVQIHYTKLNGMKCVRVITQSKTVTHSRAAAEADADVAVLGLNAVQHSAKFVNEGDYTQARAYSHANSHLLSRISTTEQSKRQFVAWVHNAAAVDDLARNEQASEHAAGLFLSDSDDEAADVTVRMSKKAHKKKMRSRARKDKSSAVMYQQKAVSKASFM
ncbi:circularly permutated Ras protein 1 [Thecamonas trahens ATCC 50062]|uniref:Circularly permutated Ras protein 1 n=1 Tax=Thecamonas trahens ATCC 50062 TaxID=461836 RepID=A0A0L0DNR0_THETB|nr:circularly permutated Ras protein 1 [Thecamonas trahens ATCC 50062]KNC53636.1 circularly permutated Ras protein 1 [Thecamonas trahens ATCC 50062]|eukprot:XP_013761953.1 circularly permutated Ras protein 1 [Thecamonas trahens ATCC 50062]